MRGKRNSLSSQIMGIQTSKRITQRLQFQKVIVKQQQVIKLLQKQISHLRQYLFYVADYDQINSINNNNSKISLGKKQNQEQHNTSIQGIDSRNQSTSSAEPTSKKISGLKGLIQQIMRIIQAKSPEQIIGKLKIMQQKANRKIQPIFIERVKQKQVPVTVEVVKEVEKIVIQQKIVQVPVFKQKIVEKYISPDQSFDSPRHGGSQIYMKKNKNDYFEAKGLNQTARQRYKQKDQSKNQISNNQHNKNQRYNKWDKYDKINTSPRWAQKKRY